MTVLLILSGVNADARGTRTSVCNLVGDTIFVTLITDDLSANRDGVYNERGWYTVAPDSCRRLPEIEIGWAAFAFAVQNGDDVRPFLYTPSRRYNRSGQNAPAFSMVCASSSGGSFGRSGIDGRYVGQTCAEGADQMYPISFKIYSDVFTDVSLQIDIDEIPEPSESHAAWDRFMKQCIASPYYGVGARYVCACMTQELERNFSAAELTFEFPKYFTEAAHNSSARTGSLESCLNSRTPDASRMSDVNERLAALGYDIWTGPPTAKVDPSEFEGLYYCPEMNLGVQLKGTVGYAIRMGPYRGQKIIEYDPEIRNFDPSNNSGWVDYELGFEGYEKRKSLRYSGGPPLDPCFSAATCEEIHEKGDIKTMFPNCDVGPR